MEFLPNLIPFLSPVHTLYLTHTHIEKEVNLAVFTGNSQMCHMSLQTVLDEDTETSLLLRSYQSG